MALDILFVNCHNAEFIYVPMGTFGICDFLEKHGLCAQILNLSLYPVDEYDSRLCSYVGKNKPRYIGLILHWKELLNSMIRTGGILRQEFPEIPIVVGGFTASCYATELMERLKFVDYIVTGDPEVPLQHLLEGFAPESIENLFFRKDGAVEKSRTRFLADRELLESMTFARLDFLVDYPLYLKRVDEFLGFPIMVGRGCIFDCEYCGGSKSAYLKHSARTALTVRRTGRIVEDVLVLVNQYDCRNLLLSHITSISKPVLRELLGSEGIRGKITVNLETWDTPDDELLSLHRELCSGAQKVPSILFTPKMLHPVEKNPPSESSIEDNKDIYPYLQAVDKLTSSEQSFHVDIFFGYFTSQHGSLDALLQEMGLIHGLRARYAGRNVSVIFLAFSSDPGSLLNEMQASVECDLRLETINRSILFDRNISTNILLHRPRELSIEDKKTFEKILYLSEFVFHNLSFVYWILTAGIGHKRYIEVIERASQNFFYDDGYSSYEISPSNAILALNCIKRSIEQLVPEDGLLIDGLNMWLLHEIARRLRRREFRKASMLPMYLTLNRDKIFTSCHNFEKALRSIMSCGIIEDSLLAELRERKETSLYLFEGKLPIRLTMEELDVLEMFNGINDTDYIVKYLSQKMGWPGSWIQARIRTLYEQGVLIER